MPAPRLVTDQDMDRVSGRLLGFVFDLLRHHGADPWALGAALGSVGPGPALPGWVAWADYIAAIHRLGEVAGGAAGIAATMRATLDTAYSELRALASFFTGPLPFFAFVIHHLNGELVPCARGVVETLDGNRARIRYRLHEAIVPSRLYLEGSITLTEVFPRHVDLPEARVEVLALTDRSAELIAHFPDVQPKIPWGARASSLTQREQAVLRLVCQGLTNAQIGATLGTSPSTVKTQISSILAKMEVANRTELAALASRRP